MDTPPASLGFTAYVFSYLPSWSLEDVHTYIMHRVFYRWTNIIIAMFFVLACVVFAWDTRNSKDVQRRRTALREELRQKELQAELEFERAVFGDGELHPPPPKAVSRVFLAGIAPVAPRAPASTPTSRGRSKSRTRKRRT